MREHFPKARGVAVTANGFFPDVDMLATFVQEELDTVILAPGIRSVATTLAALALPVPYRVSTAGTSVIFPPVL
jgi:hypothetical protein